MVETSLLRDLTVVMTIAAGTTLLCHRFHQPLVIGYLVAGLIIGPYTPPFSLVRDLASIHTMAELGLVFLMFALGLEFSLPKLRRVGGPAALAASFEVLGMLAIGYCLGRLFGWNQVNSIFLGAILSMSSTTIIVKVFMDLKLLKEGFAQVVFGILILEDVVAVLILSVLSGLGAEGGDKTLLLVTSMMGIGFFIVLFLVFGLLLVPRLLCWVARFQVKEMMGIVALGLCLGGALLAASFGFSVALGAFLIGAVIAASEEITQIEEWIHPVRDMFSAIFFVSAGMMIQPHILWDYKGSILIITLATLVGKVVTDSAGAFLAGLNLKTSFKIGVSLGQIGEFSFVIASLGASLKVTSDFFYPLAVGVSTLTTLCTPYLIRNADGLVDFMMRMTPAPCRKGLERYQAWVARPKGENRMASGTTIISRYLVRLMVYVAVLIGVVLLTRGIALSLPDAIPTVAPVVLLLSLWAASAFVSLPLFVAIAKYANHLLLLTVTQIPLMLRIMNVRYFYNTTLVILLGILAAVYLWAAHAGPLTLANAWPAIALTALGAVLMRKGIAAAAEKMEELLDDVLGLATSEPTRKAVMTVAENSFLHGVMEPVALTENSLAIGQSIRSLRLRKQTGVSVIAIYRDGQHLANPSPDTELSLNDVLVIIGNLDERGKAKAILFGGESASEPHA